MAAPLGFSKDYLRYNPLNMRHMAHEDPHSEVTIIFRNKDFEERFLPILTELASDLIQGHITVDELRDIKFSKYNSLDERESIKDFPEGELFQLDNSTTEPNENPHVPKYETSFSEVLEDEDGKNKLDKKSEKPKFRKVCFNCGEDHFISKCPHKINYYKVANAKKHQRGPPPTVRYHLNKEQGESGFKPGILREAFWLKKQPQFPLYNIPWGLINYPPGWLQEAMVETSGIAVYDSSDSVLRNENEENADLTMNRSEIRYDPAKFIDFPGFNVPLPSDYVDECYKLGFPPMQEHHLRSYVEQNMPKLDIRPNRKRKLQLKIEGSNKIQRCDEDMDLDEDLGETFLQFTPPLPQDAPPPPPPEDAPEPPPEDAPEPPLEEETPEPPPEEKAPESPPEDAPEPPFEETNRTVVSHDSDSGCNTPMSDSIMEALAPVVERFKMEDLDSADVHSSSPSLKELEEMKKRLVMELGIVSECSSPGVQDDSQAIASDPEELNPSSDSRCSFPCQDSSNDLSNFSDSSSCATAVEIGQSSGTVQRSESVCSKSKQMTLGTPSLSRHSSYQKLPDYDKFAQNVTSHICFENLPNSTGTYEKMKKVLKKVKEKFNALMP
ncbi:Zinc finger CCHC domain-containing protein 8 [Argiope bruennichi]|uniref:Zinc finger CCHC domain-containing protein 8 n=1 Tax=Argiope bruennichi TaxID=94029 RepID=A0A8T0EMV1_ARGBR|nr:Zinc finger CCHC domain-containing protein 8 [Argiope bruennichi]